MKDIFKTLKIAIIFILSSAAIFYFAKFGALLFYTLFLRVLGK